VPTIDAMFVSVKQITSSSPSLGFESLSENNGRDVPTLLRKTLCKGAPFGASIITLKWAKKGKDRVPEPERITSHLSEIAG